MSLTTTLQARADGKCELCAATEDLAAHPVAPHDTATAETAALLCATCHGQIVGDDDVDADHWRCLSTAMWSEHAPVKVLAYRLLKRLGDQGWASDLLGQIYLDDDTLAWAEAGVAAEASDSVMGVKIVDSNGTQLADGDSVTLIKDLEVKGGGFTAKRGTMVKNITLTDDPKYVEGKVNGIRIVLVAAYLKKA
jgi:protein PhnA